MADPDAVNDAVGRNLRRLRARRSWTLDALSARAAVSKGMLIQMEQARTNPSLAILCRVAEAFDVSLAQLVELDQVPSVRTVANDQGAVLWTAGSSYGRLLVGSDRTDHLELWEWRLEAGVGHASEAHVPGTEELLHVTAGALTLEVDGATHAVQAGGGAAFEAARPHAYRNHGTEAVRFTMVVVQPESDLDPGALHDRTVLPEDRER